MMPQILKVAHFVEQNSVSQMQVRRGGVKSGLDSERTIQGSFCSSSSSSRSSPQPRLMISSCSEVCFGHSSGQDVLPMVICRKTPIDQLVEYSVDIIHATVLVIKVVGMFPHVDSQERLYSLGQWQIRVARLDHFELVAILHQPRPATTKLCRCRSRQLFFACIHGIERSLDFLLQLCRRVAAAFWETGYSSRMCGSRSVRHC